MIAWAGRLMITEQEEIGCMHAEPDHLEVSVLGRTS